MEARVNPQITGMQGLIIGVFMSCFSYAMLGYALLSISLLE
jgi:hypothetical protein